MAKCPSCGNDIDRLQFVSDEHRSFDFFKDGEFYETDYTQMDIHGEWWCFECYDVVAKTKEEAMKILKGIKK